MRERKTSYPNLFIVGAPKSGTTSMAKYLSTHSHIYTPLQKEFTYFGSDLVRYATLIEKDQYLKWFEPWKEEKYALDASPFYLYSKTAPTEILEKSPDAKFIIMLRKPSQVAYSMYYQARFGGGEDQISFERAWELESDRIAGRNIPPLARLEFTTRYQTIGKYSEYVENYLNICGKDRVHIIFFEDLKSQPVETYQKLLSFLQLDSQLPEEFSIANPSKKALFPKLTRFISSPPKWMGDVTGIIFPKEIRWKVRNYIMQKNTVKADKPKISEKSSIMLQEHFRSDIKALEKLLSIDLSHWY
ncbi:sulfotransferase [Aliiglaciecola sp. NS0011-25]|uniref:sulfotransferase family protein n=1 Tax=Aliiglaciecola sp. NS0011-25 TaxID=3127654 RepID=UPI00310935A1